MANTTAFGVANVGDQGTSPLSMRKSVEVLFDSPGVVSGLSVTGASGGYSVAPGLAVTKRGPSDGMALAWSDGGLAVPASTSNASANPRLDAVWLVSHDPQFGDADNLVALGVTQGAPAPSPAAPAVPAGCTLLALMRVPAGAASPAQATRQSAGPAAIVKGATMGVLANKVYTADNEFLKRYTEKPVATATFSLPRARTVSFGLTVSVKAAGCASDLYWAGSGYVQLWIDGAKARTFRFECNPYSPICLYFEDKRALAAGAHTVKMSLWGSTTKPASDLYLCYAGAENWPGQVLTVVDEGAAS